MRVLGLLLLIPSLAVAQREPAGWPDYALGSATSVLILVDWAQTARIAERPDLFNETNPLLGKHPSKAKVNVMVGAAFLANLAISRLHKKELRRVLWAVVLGVELKATYTNHVSGVRMKWMF